MITIWHNPRCSKSRSALALIEQSGADVTIHRYLDDAPSTAEIKSALALLGMSAGQVLRSGEKQAKELGLTKTSDDALVIAAMAQHPILIERPIVLAGEKAVIGRPPENVLQLL